MNENILNMKPSGIRRFTALAKATPGCKMLTIGEPDFDTPEPIRAAAAEAMAMGLTHYAPNKGTDSLRKAIAEYETKRGMDCTADNILITVGATGALNTALTGLLNPGEEVIIPIPAFPLYESIAVAAGAKSVFLDLKESNFQIEKAALEACISPKTRAIVLNSPNNPTGCVLSEKSLNTVAELAQEHDFYILCDNVYAALSPEPVPDLTLRPELRDRVILCQSFSKPWAMTGWRLGWLAAPPQLIDKFTLLQAAQIASVPTFLQKAAETALQVEVQDMAAVYRKRREYMLTRLDQMGLGYPRPEGAFYVFPDISRFGMDSEEFCTRLISEGGLAAVPGSCFGGEGHIRLSYCYSDGELRESLDRLERFIQSINP
ncbi:MAG: aminotransferase class I/II-fold pyridoxal phosphate-dependent enzyme [Oscillospiraceae bacterium]|nr:aminotransferase class I/II-fold pyridoxal phosphate-dependent enzyme [Oscillospiraceae bacterium]